MKEKACVRRHGSWSCCMCGCINDVPDELCKNVDCAHHCCLLDGKDLTAAKELVAHGWMGTSNRHRTIARLPEGMTGLTALKRYAPDEYRHIMENAERHAADSYRRMYAMPEDQRTLDIDEWLAFKKAGGEQS